MIDNLFEIIKKVGQKPYETFVRNWAAKSIQLNSYDSSHMSKNGFVFKQYKSLEDAFNFINEIRSKSSKSSYEKSALSFVSDNKFKDIKSFKEAIKQPRPQFDKIKKISKVITSNIKTLINLGGLYKYDKIEITEDTRGVFDFGLASLGLYRPIEFYSEELKEDIKKGDTKDPFQVEGLVFGVINPNRVDKKIVGDTVFFIFNHNSKQYFCEKRQRGATSVFNTFEDKCYLKENQDGIIITYDLSNREKVFNGIGSVRLKYASSNKKSYLIYSKKDDSVKNVDIFMPVNFIGHVNDSSRGLFLLPAYLIAETLEQYGIQSRISALRTGSDKGTLVTVSIPVKEYEESCKEAFESIYALLSTDAYAGNFFAFFKVMAGNEGIQAPSTYDVSSAFSEVDYHNRVHMNSTLQRYKNWTEENKNQSFVNTKVSNKNFQFALNTTGNDVADDDVTYDNILDYIHDIFYTFYYYMDFLAIEMLPMSDFLPSIYKRITEDITFNKIFERPKNKTEIIDLLRIYVIGILVEKYQVVASGSYSDSQQQIELKERTFKEKVLLLNEVLNII